MTHETIDTIERLRRQGYRVTPQRLIVLDAVCEVGGHADFGAIYASVKYADPTIDKSTIYRALDVLSSVGLIVVTDIGDEGKVYKIAGESGHHHLVCQSCGHTLTFEAGLLKLLAEQLQTRHGFTLYADHISLVGLCQHCRENNAASDNEV